MEFANIDFKTADEIKNYANELHFRINQLLNQAEIPEKLCYDTKFKLRGIVEDGKAGLKRLITLQNFVKNWETKDQQQVLKLKDIIEIWGPVIKSIEKTKEKLEKLVPKEKIDEQSGPTLPFYTSHQNK